MSVDISLLGTIQRDQIYLTVTAEYTFERALSNVRNSLILQGVNLSQFSVGHLSMSRNMDELVTLYENTEGKKEPEPEPEKENQLAKSKEQLSAYVLYVFDKAGTEEEKAIAQKVIEKFKKVLI